MRINSVRLVAVLWLLGVWVAHFVGSKNALGNPPIDCTVSCSCKEVYAYVDVPVAGNGWKEVKAGGDIPITWGEPNIEALDACAQSQQLGTETVRFYDYNVAEVCTPYQAGIRREADPINDGIATDFITTRRICSLH